MTPQARLTHIHQTLQGIQTGWPYVLAEINSHIESLTGQLVNQESEQVRGRIKALRDLRDMPEALDQERQALSAALADQAAAD
jgi:hypothetical protein